MTTECPFCLIVAGDAPARVVYADDHSIAFLPLNPATPGHTLVVPKEHVADFFALSEASALPLGNAVSKVARAVRSAVSADGMNLITSSGVAAQQTVFHLHIHVVPRMEGDAVGDTGLRIDGCRLARLMRCGSVSRGRSMSLKGRSQQQ